MFDAAHAILRYLVSGVEKTLTEREAGLLKMLCVKMGEVVKREVILSTFWEKEDDYFASRSLDVFVTRLRKLLIEDEKVQIKTLKGVGISLVCLP